MAAELDGNETHRHKNKRCLPVSVLSANLALRKESGENIAINKFLIATQSEKNLISLVFVCSDSGHMSKLIQVDLLKN